MFTNSTPATIVRVDNTQCPDEFVILRGEYEAGDPVTCETCETQHQVLKATQTAIVD